jgi:hypothetical protein
LWFLEFWLEISDLISVLSLANFHNLAKENVHNTKDFCGNNATKLPYFEENISEIIIYSNGNDNQS